MNDQDLDRAHKILLQWKGSCLPYTEGWYVVMYFNYLLDQNRILEGKMITMQYRNLNENRRH